MMQPEPRLPEGIDDLAAKLEELERLLHQRGVRQDPARAFMLLAEEFREFGSSGRVWSRESILEALAGEPVAGASIEASDFHLIRLAADAALLTYIASRDGVRSLRSSLWVLRDERWQMLFHQGTLAG